VHFKNCNIAFFPLRVVKMLERITIIIVIIFYPIKTLVAQKLPKKISHKILFGSVPYSCQSLLIKPVCSWTELNRCIVTEIIIIINVSLLYLLSLFFPAFLGFYWAAWSWKAGRNSRDFFSRDHVHCELFFCVCTNSSVVVVTMATPTVVVGVKGGVTITTQS